MSNQENRVAFTPAKLVVVITILAVLGTVGFLSIREYSSRSSDSTRTADVAQLESKTNEIQTTVPTASAYSSATTYTAGQAFIYSGATVTVSATGIGTSSTKADLACDTNDIAVWQ